MAIRMPAEPEAEGEWEIDGTCAGRIALHLDPAVPARPRRHREPGSHLPDDSAAEPRSAIGDLGSLLTSQIAGIVERPPSFQPIGPRDQVQSAPEGPTVLKAVGDSHPEIAQPAPGGERVRHQNGDAAQLGCVRAGNAKIAIGIAGITKAECETGVA